MYISRLLTEEEVFELYHNNIKQVLFNLYKDKDEELKFWLMSYEHAEDEMFTTGNCVDGMVYNPKTNTLSYEAFDICERLIVLPVIGYNDCMIGEDGYIYIGEYKFKPICETLALLCNTDLGIHIYDYNSNNGWYRWGCKLQDLISKTLTNANKEKEPKQEMQTMPNGIFRISKQQYADQYFILSPEIIYDVSKLNKMYMLHYEDRYAFIMKNKTTLYSMYYKKKKKLYKDNINLYYEKLCKVTKDEKFEKYKEYLSDIAHDLDVMGFKDIDIHGCIIDIFGVNHMFVDPETNDITMYFAIDTKNRDVYWSFDTFIEKFVEDSHSYFDEVDKKRKEIEEYIENIRKELADEEIELNDDDIKDIKNDVENDYIIAKNRCRLKETILKNENKFKVLTKEKRNKITKHDANSITKMYGITQTIKQKELEKQSGIVIISD